MKHIHWTILLVLTLSLPALGQATEDLNWEYSWWEDAYQLQVEPEQLPQVRHLADRYPNAEWDWESFQGHYELEVDADEFRRGADTATRWNQRDYDYNYGGGDAYEETELSDIEWEAGEGYHEEEWYDPSDWFDADAGIEYETDDWNWGTYGYDDDYDETYGYDGYYDTYDYGDYDYDTYDPWFESWYWE